MINKIGGYLLGIETKDIYSQIISFDEWDGTKAPRLITIQTIDNTIVKPGGVVIN